MKAASKSLVLAQRNIAALQEFQARIQSPGLADFVGYLLSIHPADRLPARRDFDPLDIPALLPGIVLTNVEYSSGQVRLFMKLVGQDVVEASPVPVARRYLDDILTDLPDAKVIVQSRLQVVETGCAYLRQGRPAMPFTFRMAALEYLHCPLSEDGETVNQILSYFSYDRCG
ncbi:MAG: hypothetical protein VW600_13530 [Ferrovibrio sp.]